MRVLFLVLTISAFCNQVVAETRIDASTQDRFNQTFDQMKRELPTDKIAELNIAIALLPFAGMNSAKDTPPDGIVKLDYKKLDGLTASQIIALARSTVTVKMKVGDLPGLPPRFTVPLRDSQGEAAAAGITPHLVGTRWDITSNINGFISHQQVTLRHDGELDDGSSSHSRWEQLGTAVKLAFNDSYAVYLGTVDGASSMHGSAGNVHGGQWTWTARRSDAHSGSRKPNDVPHSYAQHHAAN